MEVSCFSSIANFFLSLFVLVSTISCLPHETRLVRANVRFPQDTLYGGDEFGMYDSDISGDGKRIRSPINGWPMESQFTSQESHNPAHSNSRSDDIRPQLVHGGGSILDDNSKIHFPDEVSGSKDQEKKNKTVPYIPFIPNGYPPCANGKSFCENADVYPRSHLKNVLQKDEKFFQAYFGKDVVFDNKDLTFRNFVHPTSLNDSLMNRIDSRGQIQEKSLCQTQERIVFPKMAENSEGNWLFVANVDNYIQGIRVEECVMAPGTPCDPMASFPFGYTATCEQKYMYRKLVALNSNGKAISDSFRLPSCCTCKIIFNSGVLSRSAGPSKPDPLPLTLPSKFTTPKPVTYKMSTRRANHSRTLN